MGLTVERILFAGGWPFTVLLLAQSNEHSRANGVILIAFAYFIEIIKMAIEMGIITWIWKTIAKIKVPLRHFIALLCCVSFLYIIMDLLRQSSTGFFLTSEERISIWFWPIILYLIIWTLICKGRRSRNADGSSKAPSPSLSSASSADSQKETETAVTNLGLHECPYCKNQVTVDAIFCANCGKKLLAKLESQ